MGVRILLFSVVVVALTAGQQFEQGRDTVTPIRLAGRGTFPFSSNNVQNQQNRNRFQASSGPNLVPVISNPQSSGIPIVTIGGSQNTGSQSSTRFGGSATSSLSQNLQFLTSSQGSNPSTSSQNSQFSTSTLGSTSSSRNPQLSTNSQSSTSSGFSQSPQFSTNSQGSTISTFSRGPQLSSNFQGSTSSSFSQNPQLTSSRQGTFPSFGSGSSADSRDSVNGVFEPLNLPSGASLLLGSISTSFNCNGLPYGYYADKENSCRVFHICNPALFENGQVETYQYSFMCGENTVFDQNTMTCATLSEAIPCQESDNFYFRNEQFGRI